MLPKINIIFAVNQNDNTLPSITNSLDRTFFKNITTNLVPNQRNALIVGYNTWNTFKLIDDMRHMIIITNNNEHITTVHNYYSSQTQPTNYYTIASYFIDAIMKIHSSETAFDTTFVIGGSQVYKCAYEYPFIDKVYITTLYNDNLSSTNPNKFINNFNVQLEPPIDKWMTKFKQTKNYVFNYDTNKSILKDTIMNISIRESEYPHYEHQYLTLLHKIHTEGCVNHARNGIIKSLYGHSIKIDLNDGFPILTTKRVFWRGIVEELLWMLRGETDATLLKDKGIHIWDGNTSRDYLDSIGLHSTPTGTIGKGYGYQFRHGKVDQWLNTIHLLKHDPSSRRNLINLWNVDELDEMALPPCHMLYQFSVENNKIHCQLYQRSWDILLGWNTSTAALMTHILAKLTGYSVGTLTHTIHNAHIYGVHDKEVDKMFERIPYKLPRLEIDLNLDNSGTTLSNLNQITIEDFEYKHFKLVDYQHHPSIKLDMVA